ncbi:MAG TPA: cytochrome c [Holophagaceae bacterium]
MRGVLAVLLFLPALPVRAEGRDLKRFFEARCAVCHGADGTGRGAGGIRLGPASFADPKTFGTASDEELAQAIRRGSGAMPAFGFVLDDAEARRLVGEVIRPMGPRKRR